MGSFGPGHINQKTKKIYGTDFPVITINDIVNAQVNLLDHFGIKKLFSVVGAGSDEVIQMLCQLFLIPKDEVIVPQYSFLMYRIYAKIVGANVIFSKEKKFKVSVSEIIKNVTKKTKSEEGNTNHIG